MLDGRKDEKAEYWLKLIESVGGDSPILVVINKIDQNPGFEVNQKTLKRKYKNIKGFYRLSCATNKGVKAFIPELKEALVDFLNDLGVILHFRDLELHDTHVLNPEWVTEGAYKIINSENLAEGKGILKINDLGDILKKRDEDRFDYPPDKYRYIVELMKKFELCFGIDMETILVPDLLQVPEMDFNFDFPGSLKFVIEYDFLPRSVMPRFIVRMHKDINDELRWRTGVVLHNKKYRATAVVTVDHEDKKISVFVKGEQKRDYFSVIRHTIQEINDSFEKLSVIELVPLPDNPEITIEYEELIGLERMGTEKLNVGKLGKQYSVAQLLDGIERPQERGKMPLPPKEEVTKEIFEIKPSFAGITLDVKELLKKIFKKK